VLDGEPTARMPMPDHSNRAQTRGWASSAMETTAGLLFCSLCRDEAGIPTGTHADLGLLSRVHGPS